ncbi:hypothetical protein [Arthrobacter sp. ISL-95]|uniref:VG15 protein n=1 Tax=Arthrobacter sp. ISL-95 TaxID=2819116 RepID=UPI001BEA7539|nr:hypothetical protein [Arthrobacter sp. ISL-95]MBT2587942.1 hypothetical protein [Arthrobacter sp. ISL-95]
MATLSEIEAIEEAHRAAQARLGIVGAYLALADWNTVSAVAAAETAAGWLSRSLRMIVGIRRYSRRIAQSYYQLARALETGRSLGMPEYSDDPEDVTMSGLRKQYLDLLLEIATLDTERPGADVEGAWLHDRLNEETKVAEHDANRRRLRLEDSSLDRYIQALLDAADDSDSKVEIDDFDWLDDLTEEEVEQAFGQLLLANAVEVQVGAVKALRGNDELTPDMVLDKAAESHLSAGSAGAGKVDKYGISAGRDAIDDAIRGDGRVELFARKCGPNPCYWCAMLASRGFVYTKSSANLTKRSTTVGGSAGNFEEGSDGRPLDVRKFHDNCHCTIISRWQLQSKLPADNQFYQESWNKVTEGLGGKAAMSAWRAFMYRRQRDQLAAIRDQVNSQNTP